MGATFERVAESGPLLLAIAAAALAGLVSFLSPCVLPLIPGYLSYVTGLAGSELDAAAGSRTPRSRMLVKSRILAGTFLFIVGFTTVFTLTAVLVAGVGRAMLTYRQELQVGIGLLIVLLGLAFLGLVPGLQREFRIHRLPAAGLLGAPVLGAVFALSWVPCVGPTLGAVLGLAATSGSTGRAVVLAVAYCLGLGLPFMIFGLGFERLLGLVKVIRRNSRWVTRLGGALLIIVGLALITGGWQTFLIWLRTSFGVGEVII